MKHISYPSIPQYRGLLKAIEKSRSNEQTEPNLKIKFTGTVKVHGTQASVVVKPNNNHYTQSKKRTLTLMRDNFGFDNWHGIHGYEFDVITDHLKSLLGVTDTTFIYYGEWAGRGIQKGVAVDEVDRFFYIYAIKMINDEGIEQWLIDYPIINVKHARIFDSRMFGEYSIEVELDKPDSIVNELIELTTEVENNCPVGKKLGATECSIGEGIVWNCIVGFNRFSMKVKGDKHSSSKMKRLVSVDVEKLENVDEFVTYAVTENRLNQMYSELFIEYDRKLIGKFIENVMADVIKEEFDTLTESGLMIDDVRKAVVVAARTWIIDKEYKFD